MAREKTLLWPYQRELRISAAVSAEHLFGKLDARLRPQVAFVAIRDRAAAHYPETFVEQNEDIVNPELLDGLWEEAGEHAARNPARDMLFSAPGFTERHREGIRLTGVKTAIESRMCADGTWTAFASHPVDFHGYLLLVILRLLSRPYSEHYHLNRTMVESRYEAPRSLIESAVSEFQAICQKELRQQVPGENDSGIGLSALEMLRRAGHGMTTRAAIECGGWAELNQLFEIVSAISALAYERTAAQGELIFAPANHPSLRPHLRLKAAIPLRDAKAARKALELTRGGLSALVAGAGIYALGEVVGYDGSDENLFHVRLIDRYAWQFLHNGHVLMNVHNGTPALPRPRLNALKLQQDLPRIFPGLGEATASRVTRIVEGVAAKTGGALLVVSDHAAEEAVRLKATAQQVEPVGLTAEIATSVSGIDGAVLMDTQGKCHAIGAILDGVPVSDGTSARGSRYNSAVRYVRMAQGLDHQCMAIVLSEDGPIDFVPDLLPRIPRAVVDGAINVLAELEQQPGEIDRSSFYQCMRTLQALAAYLTPAEAAAVNERRKVVEARLEPAQLWIVHDDLEGNPQIDATYFTGVDGACGQHSISIF